MKTKIFKMKTIISVIGFVAMVLGTTQLATAGIWATLDMPGTSNTFAYGIDGSNIVGSNGGYGLLYDGSTWTTLDMHGGAYGIDGSHIVICSGEFGSYLYNVTSSTWTPIHMPGAYITYAYGIDGSNIVGGSGGHGFLYDGSTWTTLDMPGADGTMAQGIDGSNIVGRYWDDSGNHGFLYNGSGWTTLDMPGASSTYAYGIDGSNIVGYYDQAHGFIYTIPEPATLLLLGLGTMFVRRRK